MWYKRGLSSSVLLHPTDDVSEHFLFGKELGSGFSGVVRQCTDRSTGEELACKSIKKANLEDEDDFDDVRLEIAVMRRLNGHAGVVALRGVFEDPDSVHIIMELCEGGDLFDEVVKRGPLSEVGAARVIAQIAEAVSCCHAKGVMHRDLKPENILLSRPSGRGEGGGKREEQENFVVKLADFGLAMFLGPFQEASGFAGSPYYVAPEVLSQTWYGREADIWSLGVVLYVMLSGEFPFAGKTDAKLYKAIKRGRLTFSHPPWPSISVLAKSLIRSMLALDPRSRPTATEILQHPWIQRFCDTPSQRVGLSNLLMPKSAAAYFAASLGGFLGSSPPSSPAHLSPPEAEPPITSSHVLSLSKATSLYVVKASSISVAMEPVVQQEASVPCAPFPESHPTILPSLSMAPTMNPPKVLSVPKGPFSASAGADSPKSVLACAEEVSDSDSETGEVEKSGDQMPSPTAEGGPPSLVNGVLSACLWRISAACTCYSSALLGRCLSRRRPATEGMAGSNTGVSAAL